MRELRSGLLFLALAALAVWESLRAGLGTLKEPGSGFLSLCAGVILAALSLAIIAQGRGKREPLQRHSRRVMWALLALFAYSLLLEVLGFLLATFLLLTGLFWIGERRRWWIQVGMSLLLTLLVYLVFGVWLHVYFPQGFLRI